LGLSPQYSEPITCIISSEELMDRKKQLSLEEELARNLKEIARVVESLNKIHLIG
jgi:hypothetical protein